jgi:hypothetical protein
MKSVPPCGSGWVRSAALYDGLVCSVTHPLPQGGTDFMGPAHECPEWHTKDSLRT